MIMRILVGDDNVDFAKKSMPYIPDSEVAYFSSPQGLIEAAKNGCDMVITDLEYTQGGREGFDVLEALKGMPIRKILWTGRAQEEEIKNRANEFGVELLDKNELATLVGMAVSNAPIKKCGLVLIYCRYQPETPIFRALKSSVELFFNEDSRVVVSADLRGELLSGKYGLAIDTTPALVFPNIDRGGGGVIAHDIKNMNLPAVPKVITLYNIQTILMDIVGIISEYLGLKK